jgi:outer membrane protein TolC
MHTSRLLVPQEGTPIPIKLDTNFHFDLEETDLINLSLIPDFPKTRGEAIERAKKQRLEVRLLVLGLKIAQLQESRDFLRLFGLGTLPFSMSFKRTSPGPVNAGPATLGIIFGTLYDLPALDIGIWSNIRKSKLDVIKSQLDLEKVLLDVEEDAGNAWDRWEQSIKEYDQRTREEALALELMERQERLLAQKQSIELDVLAAKVGLYQAQANRWGGWYNLQLARLNVLRSNELLLDFIEKAGIANLEKNRVIPTPGLWTRVLHRIYASKEPLE